MALQRSVESMARDQGLRVVSLSTRAGTPRESAGAASYPVDLEVVLEPRDGAGRAWDRWPAFLRRFSRLARLTVIERLTVEAQAAGRLKMSGVVRLHYWPGTRSDVPGEALLRAKVDAIADLRAGMFAPLGRARALGESLRHAEHMVERLTFDGRTVTGHGAAPWPYRASEMFAPSGLQSPNVTWTASGPCQVFDFEVHVSDAPPATAEEPGDDPRDSVLAGLMAFPDDLCRPLAANLRRLPVLERRGRGGLTLRLRGVDVVDLLAILHAEGAPGFVVEDSVGGLLDGDLTAVSLDDVLSELGRHGVHVSTSGRIRHVSTGPVRPLPDAPSKEQVVNFTLRRARLDSLLELLHDLSGLDVVDASGGVSRVSVFAREEPWDRLYESIVAGLGLRMRVEGRTVTVERTGGVTAAGRPVPSSEDPPFRGPTLAVIAIDQLEVSAISEKDGRRTAWMLTPRGTLLTFRAGDRLFDGVVTAVETDRVLLEEQITDPLATVRTRPRTVELPVLRR
jgi:hypothetical protein